MASLGSFAAAKREYEPPADPDDFEFCGETFTVRGEIPGMIQLTVAAWFSGKTDGNEGAAALRDAIRHALTVPADETDEKLKPGDDSEWQRFHGLAVDRGVEIDQLAEVAYVLLGAAAGRPTERRSGSSPGSSPTSTPSNSSS